MQSVKQRNNRFLRIRRDWRLYAMLAIPFVWYLVFCYKPMAGIIIAFQKYSIFKGIAGSKYVGLENFKFVFGMRDFGVLRASDSDWKAPIGDQFSWSERSISAVKM